MVHWFDIFVVVFLLVSATWSCWRGFIRETFSLVSLIIGFFVASTFFTTVAPYFKIVVDEKHFQEMISFLLLFIVTGILVNIAGILVRKSLHVSGSFGFADRLVGLGAGLAKGVLILALLVYPLAFFPGLQKELARKSMAAPKLVEISVYIMATLAPGFVSTIDKAVGQSRSIKSKSKSAAKYRKQLKDVKAGIQKTAEQIKERIDLAIGNDESLSDKQRNKTGSESEINESDREALEKLIKKLE